MSIFMTGATGWIGKATVPLLLEAGHVVEALARSDGAEKWLLDAGVSVKRGSLDDLDKISEGAAVANGVIHLANKHDYSDMAATSRAEHLVVAALCRALEGSDRPLVLASVLTGVASNRPASEADPSPFEGVESLRGGSENLALSYVNRGVRATPIRFAPAVHGTGDPGLTAMLVDVARKTGISAYIGDGANRWASVHVTDAAALVAVAIERAPGGAVLHAVAETGVMTRSIAAAIGAGLQVPSVALDSDAALEHFGWLGMFFGMDISAESARTRSLLGWRPAGPTLLEDLASDAYFAQT